MRAQRRVLAEGQVRPRIAEYIAACLLPSRWSLSVQAVLGGGGVRGGGIVGQGAAAAGPRAAVQQVLQLSGDAAGERRVDPRVGAGVQAGQQHQDGERDPCARTNTHAGLHFRLFLGELEHPPTPPPPPAAAHIVLFSLQ